LAGAIGASAYLPWMPMRSLLSFSAQTEAAAGVVIRQRHGFKDEKSAHKAHAGKQLFPEVHFLHLVRLQRRIHFFQPIDPTQVVFFLLPPVRTTSKLRSFVESAPSTRIRRFSLQYN
jgi:hypothetical protein